MRWYKDRPEEGDFVVATLTDVDRNSAYADLEEYEDVEGLIHISEVSRSWVQDMTKELDEGEKTVAQVIDDEEGDTVTLSLKRVNDNNKREAMEKWKKEQKAESFIENLAEKLGMEKEEAYEEVGFKMQERFGSSFHGFEISEAESEKLLELFDEDTVEAIQEVARDSIDFKQEKLEGKIEMSFPQGDGVKRIKDALSEIGEGVEVNYISAPEYSITAWGRTQELAKKRIDDSVKTIREKVDELDGNFEFSRA